MALDAPHHQFPADVEHRPLDRGTAVWAVRPGPDAIAEIPLVPGSTVFSEDFEGTPWSQIFFVGGDWFVTGADSHSPSNSFESFNGTGSASNPLVTEFTINDFSFSPQLSFWYKQNGIDAGAVDLFEVLFDGTPVFSNQVDVPVWTRVAIPTNFAFNITFRFTQQSPFANSFVRVDDIVFGGVDTPGVPGSPAHPLVYAPFRLTDDGERLKVEPSANFKYVRINATVAGNTLLVPAVVGKRIRVVGYVVATDDGGYGKNVEFRSGTTTVLAGPFMVDKGRPLTYEGGLVAPAFETAVGAALNINLDSAGKVVSGHLTYVEVH